MPIFVAAWHDTGDPNSGYSRWISTGARPIWFLASMARSLSKPDSTT
jgi:hypothetical protein